MKTKVVLEITQDDNGNIKGYSISLPYDDVEKLTKKDNEIIERIRDKYFWRKGFVYDGRESFDNKGGDTYKLKFKIKE